MTDRQGDSSPYSADLLSLSMQLNRQAFAQPAIEGWLNSFLALLCERFPAVRGVQLIQAIGNMGVPQGQSGSVPANSSEPVPLDSSSPVSNALHSRQRSAAPDLQVYPILFGDEAVGGLVVYAVDLPAALDEALSILALQLGTAIMSQPQTSGKGTGPLRSELSVIRSLNELTRDVTGALKASDALQLATRSIVETLGVDHATILINNPVSGMGDIVAEYPLTGGQGTQIPLRGNPMYDQALRDPRPIVISDVNDAGELMGEMQVIAQSLGIRSMVVVPMWAQGVLVGSVGIDVYAAPRTFSPTEIDGMQTIAGQLAVSVRNGQLLAELERRAGQLERIANLGRRVMSTIDRNAIMRIVAEETRGLITADGVSVALHWPDEPMLYLYLLGEGDALPQVAEFAFEQAALRFVCNTGESLVLDDISGSEYPDYKVLARHAPPDAWEVGEPMRAALIVPLLVGGRAIGTYNLTRRQMGAYTSLDLAALEQIGNQLGIALENARLFAQTANRVQTERLMNRLSGSLQQGDLQAMILNTTQEIADALGAHKARVRLQMPTSEGVDVAAARLRKLLMESRVLSTRQRIEIAAAADLPTPAAATPDPAADPTDQAAHTP